MAQFTIPSIHVQRHGTKSQWATSNPILQLGVLGIETDTLKLKIGDGTSTWNTLEYMCAVISRDSADAIPALIVNQANASSTGYLQSWKFGGAQQAYIDKWGGGVFSSIFTSQICNIADNANSSVLLDDDGTVVYRNVADANPALIVNQNNASSTGNIQTWQFGGTAKASVDKDGNGSFPNLNPKTDGTLGLHKVTLSTSTPVLANLADGDIWIVGVAV